MYAELGLEGTPHSFERALQSSTSWQHGSEAIIDARTALAHHHSVGHAIMSHVRIRDRSGHQTRASVRVQCLCSLSLFEVYSGMWFVLYNVAFVCAM